TRRVPPPALVSDEPATELGTLDNEEEEKVKRALKARGNETETKKAAKPDISGKRKSWFREWLEKFNEARKKAQEKAKADKEAEAKKLEAEKSAKLEAAKKAAAKAGRIINSGLRNVSDALNARAEAEKTAKEQQAVFDLLSGLDSAKREFADNFNKAIKASEAKKAEEQAKLDAERLQKEAEDRILAQETRAEAARRAEETARLAEEARIQAEAAQVAQSPAAPAHAPAPAVAPTVQSTIPVAPTAPTEEAPSLTWDEMDKKVKAKITEAERLVKNAVDAINKDSSDQFKSGNQHGCQLQYNNALKDVIEVAHTAIKELLDSQNAVIKAVCEGKLSQKELFDLGNYASCVQDREEKITELQNRLANAMGHYAPAILASWGWEDNSSFTVKTLEQQAPSLLEGIKTTFWYEKDEAKKENTIKTYADQIRAKISTARMQIDSSLNSNIGEDSNSIRLRERQREQREKLLEIENQLTGILYDYYTPSNTKT
ncbi:MAG: hypothetical protein PHC64_09575, partial [Candidatus Gastranaerophilales bacterium]|nr:hypothetical protein [Candidatus Gastranaerophilales bacterium]